MNFASNATSKPTQFQDLWSRAEDSPPDLRSFVDNFPNLSPGDLASIVRIDQRERWSRNENVGAERYLAEFPALLQEEDAALDVIYGEYLLRESRGEKVLLPAFLARFPSFAEILAAQLQIHQWTLDTPSGTADRLTNATTPNDQSLSGIPRTGAGTPELAFGRYEIVRMLGRGGMGTIYLARDSTLERLVALKLPHHNELWNKEIETRFFQEARAAAKLSHPNICTVHDAGKIEGRPYLAMEFIEGVTLAESIREAGRYSQRKAATIAWQLASALEIAHRAGVLHRDLKSSNIMLNRMGQPVVTDFGLARIMQSEDARITTAGKILGTPAYSAPEQLEGELDQIGPASDVYSLGVILFEMLTGRLPFEGNVANVVRKVLTEDPPRISEMRPEISPAIENICLTAMQRSRELRFTSMQDMASALETVLPHVSDTEISAPNAADSMSLPDGKVSSANAASSHKTIAHRSAPNRSMRRWFVVGLWLLLIASVATGLAFLVQQRWSLWEKDGLIAGSVWEGSFNFNAPMDYTGSAQLNVTNRRDNTIAAIYSTENTYSWGVDGEIHGRELQFRFLPPAGGDTTSPNLANHGSLTGSVHGDRLDLIFRDDGDGTSAVVTLRKK
jgi:serine/threonine protein kinase